MQRPNDIMWIHLIRLLSIVAVLWVHSSAEIFFYGAPFGSSDWWVANVYDSLARTCVPLLFMISGYLLLGKSEALSSFLKRRAVKVALPLFAWSIFFILWIQFREFDHPSKASSMTPEWLQKIHDGGWLAGIAMLWTPMYYHLWFLYAILGLYLVTPLLRVLVQNAEGKLLWYLLGLSVVANVVLTIAEKSTGVPNYLQLNVVSGDVFYFVLGYMLGNMNITRRLFRSMLTVLAISALVTIVGTYYATADNKGELSQLFWWPSAPNIIAMSAAAFIVLRDLGERCARLNQGRTAEWVKRLSNAGFGIYLIHVLFLYAFAEGLFGFTLTAVSGNPLLMVPVLVFITFVASYACVFVMQKIPAIKHLVP
jgi:surface polysaccharide O-acyltransferase-like enzyme